MKKIILALIFLCLVSPAGATVTTLYPTSDTYLDPENVNTNYDTSTVSYSDATNEKILVKFDLSGINSADVLKSCLTMYGGVRAWQGTIYINRLLRDFTSNQATWNIFSTGNNWGTAGAANSTTDYSTDDQASASTPDNWEAMTDSSCGVGVDVTDMVKTMIDGNNYGFLIRGNGVMNCRWRLSEYDGTSYDPHLTIQTGAAGVPNYYYVRTNGGTCGLGNQCTGLTNADYPGTGTDQDCACATLAGAQSVMQGEDILIIQAGASLEVSGTNIFTPPAGTSSTLKTKIYGEGYNTGCTNPPEIWSNATGSYNVINLNGISNVEIKCLEITDHDDSSDFVRGIYAYNSSNVTLEDINIHGGTTGILAGKLTNWSLKNVTLSMNAGSGWNGDTDNADDSNSGTMSFENVTITYNGCSEDYSAGLPMSCCSQDQGCYGDGMGTAATSGNWTFTECNISHNTSDGLDLLYHSGSGTIDIIRSKFEGNAGNQVKTSASTTIENSIVIGNCDYFDEQDFTCTADGCGNGSDFNNCRATGEAVLQSFDTGASLTIYNSTIVSDGNGTVSVKGDDCDGSEFVKLRNNIYVGGDQTTFGWKTTLFYNGGDDGNGSGPCGEGETAISWDEDYSVAYDFKAGTYSALGTHSVYQSPLLNESAVSSPWDLYKGSAFDASIASGSPARSLADETVSVSDSLDYNSYARGDSWDTGALEYGSVPSSDSCDSNCDLCTTSVMCSNSKNPCFWWTATSACEDSAETPPGSPPVTTPTSTGKVTCGSFVGFHQ